MSTPMTITPRPPDRCELAHTSPLALDGRIALRIGEAAAAIGVCRATFWRLMHTGEIPVMHLGGCRRILRRDLEHWLEAHKEESITP